VCRPHAGNNVWYEKCFKAGGSVHPFQVLEKEMRTLRNVFSVYAAIGLLVLGLGTVANAQQPNDRQVRDIVRSLMSRIDDFRFTLDDRFRDTSVSRQDAEELRRSMSILQDKVTAFEENLTQRRENKDDVVEMVIAAKEVNAFFGQSNTVKRTMMSDWTAVRGLVDRLAGNYGVTTDWNGGVSRNQGTWRGTGSSTTTSTTITARTYPQSTTTTRRTTRSYPPMTTTAPADVPSSGLSGTYQLDASRSENVAELVAGTNVDSTQRADLESKLEAPEQLTLEIRGQNVTLSSTKTQPVTFVADGSTRSEQIGGRNMQLRASFRGEDLVVSTTGGETDFTITFSPADNGRGLKVTRRVTTEYLNETVLAESFYSKTDSTSGLGSQPDTPASSTSSTSDSGAYSSNDPNDRAGTSNDPYPTMGQARTGEFIIPNGTTVTAVLDNEVSTNVSQNNDRFKMIVQSPSEFRGAVIEGHLSGVGRSGQVSGRSNVTFNFDRITLRSGETYDFGGTLISVKDQNGNEVKVDAEGTAKGRSQTKQTAKRGGVGAGLGAIIGAIAGGGQGAAIGAIIGGGVGAGSVVVQGRDDLRLLKGSTVTIASSSPIRRDQPVSEN
jgi:hypothetical protein